MTSYTIVLCVGRRILKKQNYASISDTSGEGLSAANKVIIPVVQLMTAMLKKLPGAAGANFQKGIEGRMDMIRGLFEKWSNFHIYK